MSDEITAVITGFGILVMLYCLWSAVRLKARIPGGVVGKKWGQMIAMVGFFTLGYIAIPLLGQLSDSTMRMAVSLIFLFGAIYVAITIRLIYRVIEELAA
jgi:hypothetical protein